MKSWNAKVFIAIGLVFVGLLYVFRSGGVVLVSTLDYKHNPVDESYNRPRTKDGFEGCQVSTYKNSELDQAIHSWRTFGMHHRDINYTALAELKAEFDRIFQYYELVYQQYRKITRNRNLFSDNFSHNIRFKTSGKHLKLYIREFKGKQPTKGGTTFRIALEGEEKVLCDVHDSFDGNYTACCPLVSGCVDVKVILQYLEFEPFLQRSHGDVRPELNKLLKQFQWCSPYNTARKIASLNDTSLAKISQTHCQNKTIKDYLGGRWLKTQNGWRWGTEDRCLFNYMPRREVTRCYNKLNSITFIGDSHLRNTGDYFIELLGYNMANVTYHRHYDYIPEPKISILWAPWPDTAIERLVNLTKDQSSVRTQNDVVILMTGQWDFWMRGPMGFFEESSQKLANALKNFKQDPFWSKSRVLWMQQIAYPRGVTQAGFRSNPISSAANAWMETKLRDVDVDVIDSLHVTRPLYYENHCGCHYLCRKWGHFDHTVGEVGKTLAHLLFKSMCGL
ncbi:uncharacterized protein LOC112041545 [Lingula anatina]|uniref:Uncharacterized protein LOC112041545 n=1 Tax=Lingula anatina TaxID=7574 RepID=A0A2R2MKS8_LINAN|nr:uncharacterized protein LOC112041545 [Lingula anatina]|eukprot:XP_023930662.1 uncharacterized protein LOC112041545 [Lingula anatina]